MSVHVDEGKDANFMPAFQKRIKSCFVFPVGLFHQSLYPVAIRRLAKVAGRHGKQGLRRLRESGRPGNRKVWVFGEQGLCVLAHKKVHHPEGMTEYSIAFPKQQLLQAEIAQAFAFL